MSVIDPDFIEETQRFWSRRLGREISAGEAEEAIYSVTRLFDLLASWQCIKDGVAPPDGTAGRPQPE